MKIGKEIRAHLKIILMFAILGFTNISEMRAQIKKTDLNVLYVGGSANYSETGHKPTKEAWDKDVEKRIRSFETLLNQYFNKVTVVHAKNYQPGMSTNYDVTVMDAVPGSKRYEPGYDFYKDRISIAERVKVLDEKFSAPMVFVGETGYKLGYNIGLKFDWYCLCLAADAYNIKTEHGIFSGPYPVKITMTSKPLPLEASVLNYREDKIFPAKVPMWKVQTLSYEDMTYDIKPGLICHGAGFEDSPDSEYISGGVSLKEGNAVALGRHGNYFHWGFAASPDHMTEEAKVVFINTLVHMSKMKDEKVIARKFNARIKTTYEFQTEKYAASNKAHQLMNVYYTGLAERHKRQIEQIKTKQSKGIPISEEELGIVNRQVETPTPETLEEYLKSGNPLYSKFGTDLKAYQKYYDENMDYFYGDGKIDEDLKSLKLKKSDPEVLNTAIKLWETGKDIEKGKRLLSRYALVDFDTPEAWRKWYEANKSKLFFTESGGYYFLVNSLDFSKENNYLKKKVLAYGKITTGETSDQEPVSVAAGIVDLDNGNKEVVIKFKIHPGYHIYNSVAGADPFIKTEVSIVPPSGYASMTPLGVPIAKLYGASGTTIFKESAIFTQEFAGRGEGELICRISYQCCNDNICYPPVEQEIKIKL
ncbi:protein-disulfide reductase DsbD N-terminal domain-containing protein [Parapedobacter tibetensis]|uniref:protein-disulfide reductase DsbD N-terminal domain-containing protein n=1 Tax=Parapedobacter tibetensis TaxID=2972951 RepID=UPI00214D9715|nr:protein-disulfide reductase DsbD N-terminal domain-containing protein [Parapedobacter tibetensis]